MMRNEPTSVLLTVPRIKIMENLAIHGQMTMPEIPHQWPFTRPMLEAMVRELVGVGLVEPTPSARIPGKTAYALTEEGRASLAPAAA